MKLSNSILSIILLIFVLACSKDEPSPVQKDEFYKSFGGAYIDQAIDILMFGNDFYILGNSQNSLGNSSIILIKTDEYGNRIWEKNYTYENNSTTANQIIKLKNSPEFAVIGSTQADTDSLFSEILYLHLDIEGNILTEKTINIAYRDETGIFIHELDNGNLSIGANSVNDTSTAIQNGRLIFPITIDGNFIDNKLPIITSGYNLFNVAANIDNTLSMATGFDKYNRPEIIFLTSEGKSNGSISFEFNGEYTDVFIDGDNQVYIAGKVNNGTYGNQDIYVSQIDVLEFETVWTLHIGNSGNDWANQISENSDGNLLVIGTIEDTKLGSDNILFAEVSKKGELLNTTILGGNDNENGIKVLNPESDKVIIEATTYSDNSSFISIIKTKL